MDRMEVGDAMVEQTEWGGALERLYHRAAAGELGAHQALGELRGLTVTATRDEAIVAIVGLGAALAGGGRGDDALEVLEYAKEQARELGAGHLYALASFRRLTIFTGLGRWRDAMDEAGPLLGLARDEGVPDLLASVCLHAGISMEASGGLDAAAALYREGLDAAETLRGSTNDSPVYDDGVERTLCLHLAWCLVRRGAPGEVEGLVARYRALADAAPMGDDADALADFSLGLARGRGDLEAMLERLPDGTRPAAALMLASRAEGVAAKIGLRVRATAGLEGLALANVAMDAAYGYLQDGLVELASGQLALVPEAALAEAPHAAARFHFLWGLVAFRRGDLDAAGEAMGRARDLGHAMDRTLRSEVEVLSGMILRRTGELDRAEASLDRASALSPSQEDRAMIDLERAWISLARGDTARAWVLLDGLDRAALGSDLGYSMCYSAAAKASGERLGEAISMVEAALESGEHSNEGVIACHLALASLLEASDQDPARHASEAARLLSEAGLPAFDPLSPTLGGG